MDEFMDRFYPRIINIFHRNAFFWEEQQSRVISRSTELVSFLYVYDGEGVMELDGMRYPLSPGYMGQIPFRRHLGMHSEPAQPLCYYTVQYDFTWVDWEVGTEAVCTAPVDKVLPLPLAAWIPGSEGIRTSMERLYRLWNNQQSGQQAKARLAFLGVIGQCIDHLQDRRQLSAIERAIRDSADYIEHHYRDPLERERLAKRVAMSSSYFSVMFKQHLGLTPVQYLTRIRMNKAIKLLKETRLPIAEIAREVGYEDPLYFTRVFSRTMGMTPRIYRHS